MSIPFDLDRDQFPWDDLTVNLLGSLLIGVVATRTVRNTVGWAFAATGVLGGFTTMSGFALAFNDLLRAGRTPAAITYLVVTMAGGVVALLAGARLAETRTPS